MRKVKLQGGVEVPVLGQGTWNMGEDPTRRREETAALRRGIELGMTVVDTAEMYGEGETERFLGEALVGLRDKILLVSKAYPQNGGGERLKKACEASLKRLRTDRLDLYLLHWRGAVPLAETVRGMEALVAAGKIVDWGVSNFDLDDMDELRAAGGTACAVNQILYNVTRREAEFDLQPALARRGMGVMAYSPIEQGRLPTDGALAAVAKVHVATPYQIALAWVVRQPGILAVPKAATLAHVDENRRAAELMLTEDDLRTIDAAFAPPSRRMPLPML
jgi:diketogulonate reductase-like aldo/keto reductase